MNAHYPRIAARAGHRCEYCLAPEAIFNFPFEVEHVVPPNRGGTDEEENLALACRSCNLFKSDAITAMDVASKEETALFHPRRDPWEDHFRIDASAMVIVGITAAGRATIAKLQFNNPLAVAARWQWRQLGLFPP